MVLDVMLIHSFVPLFARFREESREQKGWQFHLEIILSQLMMEYFTIRGVPPDHRYVDR
jgi:hypothetical protein